MICLVALIVFAVMGIFSVKYRTLAKESLDCVLRRATLRPCESDLNQRIRVQVVTKIFKKNKTLARTVNKYFEAIVWLFIIITIVSAYFAAAGIYNFYVYGNCDGPLATNGCVYADALGTGAGEPPGCDLNEPPPHPVPSV